MKTHDFYYDLPEELIAQTPLEKRDTSRLMVLDRQTGEVSHKHFYDILDYLQPGDCLVMNDSRVLPARLLGHRPTGGAVEVLLLRDLGNKRWECLCKPGRKMQVGNEVLFGNGELSATVVEVKEDGNRVVEFHYEGIFLEVLERLGKMPLPPYIKAELQDQERYQTVYSREVGSAAAPTAGLHWTKELLEKGQKADYEKVLKEIQQRDYQDTHREVAPLKMCRDSIKLDTSDMNLEEAVAAMKEIIEKKVGA